MWKIRPEYCNLDHTPCVLIAHLWWIISSSSHTFLSPLLYIINYRWDCKLVPPLWWKHGTSNSMRRIQTPSPIVVICQNVWWGTSCMPWLWQWYISNVKLRSLSRHERVRRMRYICTSMVLKCYSYSLKQCRRD